MLSSAHLHQAAVTFAEALDRNDFDTAKAMLTAKCRYDLSAAKLTPEGIIVGPDAIVASYKWHDERARRLFDRVEYSSVVETVKGRVATIRFVDEIEKDSQHHVYSSLQHVTFNDAAMIERIVQEDIPAETMAVRAFMTLVGVNLTDVPQG